MSWSVLKHSTVVVFDSRTVNDQYAYLLTLRLLLSMESKFVNCLLFYTLLLIVHRINLDLSPCNNCGLHHGYGSVDGKILHCTESTVCGWKSFSKCKLSAVYSLRWNEK